MLQNGLVSLMLILNMQLAERSVTKQGSQGCTMPIIIIIIMCRKETVIDSYRICVCMGQSYLQGYVRDWPPSGCFSRLPGLFLHIYNLGSYPGHTACCSFSSLQNSDSTKDYVQGGTFLITLKYLWSSIYLQAR